MKSKIQTLYESLKQSVFQDPADTSPDLRESIRQKLQSEVDTGDSEPFSPQVLNDYLEKITHNSYKIVDEDIEKLKEEGFSEPEIFELTLAASWAAGVARYERGLELLNSLEP